MKTLIYILGLLISIGANSLPYCECKQNDSIEKEIENSDLVLIGDVVSKNTTSIHKENKNLKYVEYKIKLYKSYKGINKDKTIYVYTAYDSASCRIALEYDQRYIIFGNKSTYLPPESHSLLGDKEQRSFWVSSCSKTEIHSVTLENEIKRIMVE